MIWAAVRDDQKWFYANKSYFVTEAAATSQMMMVKPQYFPGKLNLLSFKQSVQESKNEWL